MLTLIIDTSTERSLVAIVRNLVPIFVQNLPFGHNASKNLLPMIQKGLTKTSLAVNNFDAITVGIGPGSYTGIRVAASVAKALAFACQTPLIGICTLHAFSPKKDGPFATLIDAKISGTYLVKGYKQQEEVFFTSPPQVSSITQTPQLLGKTSCLLTPNSQRLSKELFSSSNNSFEWIETSPCPKQFARLANEDLMNGKISLNNHLELKYLRKTQAEIERSHITESIV